MSEPVELSLWSRAPYFFVEGDALGERVVEALRDELSYEVPDAQYTDAWKSGDWDGFQRLFRESDNGSYYFPIGTLSRVTDILEMYGVEYTVDGLSRPGRGEKEYAWNTDMTLREYQTDAVQDALRSGAGCIVMPTGAGKTVVGIRLVHELQRPALVLCHRTEIADQWVERLERILDVDVARFYGGDHESGDVQVALYQSLYDDEAEDVRDDARLDHDVLICDETHRVAAQTWRRVALSVTSPYRFGLTATFEREDNAELEIIGGTGEVIADLSVEKLIDEGYLAEPQWQIYDAPHAGGAYQNWQSEYAGEIVENEERNETIANVVGELDRPALITVERINHGERLESKIDEAKFIHGSHPGRDETIQSFRDGDVGVLIATRGIVGEGFDVPEIRSFVVAGGLKSSTAMLQQVGRALRPGGDGTATIVDFIDRGDWVGDHSEQRIRTYQDYYKKYGP